MTNPIGKGGGRVEGGGGGGVGVCVCEAGRVDIGKPDRQIISVGYIYR